MGKETQARENGAERGASGGEGSDVKDDAVLIEDVVKEEEIKISRGETDEKQVAPPPPPPGNDDSVVDDQGIAKITADYSIFDF